MKPLRTLPLLESKREMTGAWIRGLNDEEEKDKERDSRYILGHKRDRIW